MNSLKTKNVKIVEKFVLFLCISLAVIAAGIVMMFVGGGMNLGVEFKGGMTLEVGIEDITAANYIAKNEDAFKSDVNKWLESGVKLGDETYTFKPASNVQKAGEGTYEFRVDKEAKIAGQSGNYILNTESKGFTEIFSKETGLMATAVKEHVVEYVNAKANLPKKITVDDVTVRTHTIGNDVMKATIRNAAIAVAVAVAAILVYIAIRFTWISGLAAILALVHDVLVMIALTTIFKIPVNSTFIAAVITIIGYSINATIVIFDRIRELEKTPSLAEKTDAELANNAIASTLWRSILTTITTLIMIVSLSIFGNSTIKEFSLPIIFGLIAGAYSSVLLSASIWVYLRKLFRMSGKRPKLKTKAAKSDVIEVADAQA